MKRSSSGEVKRLSDAHFEQHRTVQVKQICDFVRLSSGLRLVSCDDQIIVIHQKADNRQFEVTISTLEEVLIRKDGENSAFLQVNFCGGKKILLTDNLIGFKPSHFPGLDLTKLPRVVTTPDIQSVIAAIEESLSNETMLFEEVDVLRKVFESVLLVAENVGFDLPTERAWLKRLSSMRMSASA